MEKYSYTAALVLAKQYICTLQYCSFHPNERFKYFFHSCLHDGHIGVTLCI